MTTVQERASQVRLATALPPINGEQAIAVCIADIPTNNLQGENR